MCRRLLFCILPHLTFCFWHTEFRFKFSVKIHLLEAQYKSCRGFMLKKLLMYFEMLIVPHPLHCVGSCIFFYLPHLTQSGILFWFQCSPTPPHPFPQNLCYQRKLLCQNSLTRELTVRVVGLPPPPLSPIFFNRI